MPAGITLHALVDPSGGLAQTVRRFFAGMETVRVESENCRVTVTV